MEKYTAYSIVPLRLAAALIMIHGYQKLTNIGGVQAFFDSLNIPFPQAMAWVVAMVEFGGGLLILLGLFTRYAAALISVVMIVAILTAHRADLFALNLKGFELPALFLGLMVSLMITGAGKVLNLEKILFKKEL